MNIKQSELKADPDARTADIVAQLKRLHDAGQGGPAPLLPSEDADDPPAASPLAPLGDYDALQSRIAAVEAQLRAHKDRVTAFLEAPKTAPKPAVATQATLFLQCPQGGTTGGRFICRNHFDHPADLTLQTQDLLDARGQKVAGALLQVSGADRPLGAGEARRLKCRVDLTACTTALEGPLEGAVDISFEGASRLRLWVEVALHD